MSDEPTQDTITLAALAEMMGMLPPQCTEGQETSPRADRPKAEMDLRRMEPRGDIRMGGEE